MGESSKIKKVLLSLAGVAMIASVITVAGCSGDDTAGTADAAGGSGQKVELISGLVTGDSAYTYVPTEDEDQAFDFTWTGSDGKTYSLSDFQGHPVMLNFWATWCPPCKGEMPLIEQVYQENKDTTDLVMLAVSVGESTSTVQNFIDSNGYNFRILVDSKQSVATKYQVRAIPTTYFIDANGIIQGMLMGAFPDKEHIESYLDKIMQ